MKAAETQNSLQFFVVSCTYKYNVLFLIKRATIAPISLVSLESSFFSFLFPIPCTKCCVGMRAKFGSISLKADAVFLESHV